MEASRVANKANEHLLEELLQGWEHHKTATLMFKDIFMYLDRVYVSQHNKAKVYNVGLKIYRDTVVYDAGIRERVRNILLGLVRDERAGNIVDRDILRNILNLYLGLGGIGGVNVYHGEFEEHFLKETETFYCNEAQKFLSQNSCSEYLIKSEQRIEEESERVMHYLSASTEGKLTEILLRQLIANHATALVNMEGSGLLWMLNGNRLDDLKRMYSLFSKVPTTLVLLRDIVGDFTKQCGLEIVAKYESVSDPVGFVKETLALEAKMNGILSKSFKGEKKTEKKIQDAFSEFLNNDMRCSNYISLYLDHLMRGDPT